MISKDDRLTYSPNIPVLIPKYRQKLLDHSSVAVGVVALKPMFFMDFDKPYFGKWGKPFEFLKGFCDLSHFYDFDKGNHYQILDTKNGYHVVQIMRTWWKAKERIARFIELTSSKYEPNPRFMRIRTSRKWDFKTGRTTSRAPKIVFSCHEGLNDLRFSDRTKKEYYFTLKQ